MIIDANAKLGYYPLRTPMRIKTTEQIVKMMDRFGIDMACVASVKGEEQDFEDGNKELDREAARFPNRFIKFCAVSPRSGQLAIEDLRRCVRERGFKGLRLNPSGAYITYPADCLSVQEVVGEAAKLRIPVLVQSSGFPASHPARVAALASRFPDVTVIMGHMGGFMSWPDAIEFAKQYENLILETSSTSLAPSLVKRCVEAVGGDRVVFGTNLPIDYPSPSVARITQAYGVSEETKRKIMGENIARIVGVRS